MSILEAFELCLKPSANTASRTDGQQAQSGEGSSAKNDTDSVSAVSTDDAAYSQWFDEWQQDEEGQHRTLSGRVAGRHLGDIPSARSGSSA